MATQTNAHSSLLLAVFPISLGLASTGCFSSGPAADGQTYFCVKDAPAGSFEAQQGIKVVLGDEGCLDKNATDATVNNQCQIDCQNKGWGNCAAIQGIRNPYNVTSNNYFAFIVWASDLANGINYCAGASGTIVGPGSAAAHPVGTGGFTFPDVYYSCLASAPANDLMCHVADKPIGQGLYAVSQFTATAAPVSLGSFSGGGMQATPANQIGASSLGFNLRPDGSMNLQTLIFPTKPINIGGTLYYDPSFELLDHGTVATKRSTDVYGVPPGGASFGVSLRNSAGDTLFAKMSNTTDLTIDVSGNNPKITGHVRGTLQGTQIDADINTQMVWMNHAPRLDVTVQGAAVNTANMAGATSNTLVCNYKTCEQVLPGTPPVCDTWTETYPWFGVEGYHAQVTLDATSSVEVDPNDNMLLSFENGVYGTAKTYAYPGGIAVGSTHNAVVRAQDQHTAIQEKVLTFTVTDAARPECPQYEGVAQYL